MNAVRISVPAFGLLPHAWSLTTISAAIPPFTRQAGLCSGPVNRRCSVIWLAIVFFAVGAALLAIAGVNFIAMATGTGNADYSGPGAPLGLALASLCFFCLVLMVSVLIQLEHKLRRPRWDYDYLAPAGSRRWRRGRSRAVSAPIAVSLALLMYLGVVIGFAVYAVNLHAQAALSSYVQHDGVQRTGGIVRIQNIEHQDTRNGPWYSSLITVTLVPPIEGHSTTVVHDPHGSNLIAGEGLQILVDPQQPGYAELPGQPFGQNWQWIFTGCLSLAIALVGVLPQVSMIVHMVGRYRRRGTLIGEHTQRHRQPSSGRPGCGTGPGGPAVGEPAAGRAADLAGAGTNLPAIFPPRFSIFLPGYRRRFVPSVLTRAATASCLD
jgi:hypothetical protein